MILVGIDVAKDKHDCFIQSAEGKVLFKSFSFANNYEGFEELYAKILSCDDADVRIGLEATGHYSYNLLGFLLSKELPTFVFNPLQTNQFRASARALPPSFKLRSVTLKDFLRQTKS